MSRRDPENIGLTLAASSISAVAGRHRYTDKAEALVDALLRYNTEHMYKLIMAYAPKRQEMDTVKRVAIKAAERGLTEAVATIGADESILMDTRDVETETKLKREVKVVARDAVEAKVAETVKAAAAVGERVSVPTEAAVKRAVDNAARIVEMTRGINNEDSIRVSLREALGADVVKDNRLLKKKFGYSDRHTVLGRVDGFVMVDGKKSVVEIKNRASRFFIPDYDLDQLAAYVYMSGADQGVLVQRLGNKVEVNWYPADVMLERWETIVADLAPAIALVRKIVKRPTCKSVVEFVRDTGLF